MKTLKAFTFEEAIVAAEVEHDPVDGVSMFGAVISPALFRRAEEEAGGMETTECGLPAAAIIQAELKALQIDAVTATIPFGAYKVFDTLRIFVGYCLDEDAIERALDGYLLTVEERDKLYVALQNFLIDARWLVRKAYSRAEAEVDA